MARGGIFDQIGGGFHRYSTDSVWLAPHFEKMLYDNALLAVLYLHGWQATGEPLFRQVVEKTLDYVLKEMTHPVRRLLFGTGRRLRRRRGQVLRLVAAGDRTSVGAGTRPRRQGVLGCEP